MRRERDRLQEAVVERDEDIKVLTGKVRVLSDAAQRNHQIALRFERQLERSRACVCRWDDNPPADFTPRAHTAARGTLFKLAHPNKELWARNKQELSLAEGHAIEQAVSVFSQMLAPTPAPSS